MKPPLIIFGEDWGGLPSSTQHLIGHLVKDRKVLWVNSIGLRQPRLNWHDIKRTLNKLWRKKNQLKTRQTDSSTWENDNFQVVNPLTLPAPRSRLARVFAAKLLLIQLRLPLRQAKIEAPVLWISLPTAVDLVGKLNESAVVYYCGDDFSALAGVDHATVTAREQELAEKADLIICASQRLMAKFPTSRSRLLKHGVDLKLFSTPQPRAIDLPNDGRPIAGFYGSISKWLNISLLIEVIKQRPDWHFIFIGKVVVDIKPLRAFNNVHFLGQRPHQHLPSYCQHWDVNLLPFVDNAQIMACNPR